MSSRVTRTEDSQFETFVFDKDNENKAKTIIARYPKGREASAIMPLFDLAQRQCGGWLPKSAIEYVADQLGVPHIRAYEVATFYSMYNTEPVGKYHIQICGTTPCMLGGAEEILKICEKELGIALGETSKDGLFTISEVECLGACISAPMVQINDDYYTDLTPQTMKLILKSMKDDKETKAGSQSGRHSSEPKGGATTLKGDA